MDPRNVASRVQSEFIDGEHDIEEEKPMRVDVSEDMRPATLAMMTMEAAMRLRRRDDEVAAAQKNWSAS